jgi:hypothetical protein
MRLALDEPIVVLGATSGPDPAAYREALRAVKVLRFQKQKLPAQAEYPDH